MDQIALNAVLAEALEYEAEAFDTIDTVDGDELVDWFSDWRERLRRVIDAAPAELDICSVLIVNAAHLCAEDVQQLSEAGRGCPERGWMFPMPIGHRAVVEEVTPCGEGLQSVMQTARRYRCAFVILHRNGAELAGAKVYGELGAAR